MAVSSPIFFCSPTTRVCSVIRNNSVRISFQGEMIVALFYAYSPHVDGVISGSKKGSAVRMELIIIMTGKTVSQWHIN
jgi:hypothetical protein